MITKTDQTPRPFTATRNACKLCAPLGASMAFAGIQGARTLLHGSQGCATYIRRYMISHFKDPIDIASSNFSESSAIFGGRRNLQVGLENVIRQYQPELVGVATTCLAETIGDDVGMFLYEIDHERPADAPAPDVVHVSTPSYCGTHADGYHAAIRATVEQLAQGGPKTETVNVFAPMLSPADLRYLKELFTDFGLSFTLLPDFSDTLDGPAWEEYQLVPAGGTPLETIREMGRARASIEFSAVNDPEKTAAAFLENECDVPRHRLPLPIGVAATDRLFELLESLSGRPTPERHAGERGRLVDSYVDGHKYVYGRRAAVFGEEDLVVAVAGLLLEVGIVPALCASGSETGRMRKAIHQLTPDAESETEICEGFDFAEIEQNTGRLNIELMVGNSKGYTPSRNLGLPLVRIGFPIHDRVGGARILHLGYRGTQQLFDRMTNTLIETMQEESSMGYTYI